MVLFYFVISVDYLANGTVTVQVLVCLAFVRQEYLCKNKHVKDSIRISELECDTVSSVQNTLYGGSY